MLPDPGARFATGSEAAVKTEQPSPLSLAITVVYFQSIQWNLLTQNLLQIRSQSLGLAHTHIHALGANRPGLMGGIAN